MSNLENFIATETSRKIAEGQIGCIQDMRGPFDVLSTFSFVFSFLAFAIKIGNPRNRTFPDCISVVSCGAAAGFSFSEALSGFVRRKHLAVNASTGYVFVCRLQAIMFQMFIVMILWNWIFSMIIVYQIVVLKRPISAIRTKKHWYFITIAICITITTLYPIILNKHGHVEAAGLCWVTNDAGLRINLFFSHAVVGMIVFLVVAIPLLLAMQKARKSLVLYPTQTSVLKDEMVRQIVQAVVLFLIFSIVFLHGMNLMLLKVWGGGIKSTYIATTGYTYCMLNGISLAFLGFAIALIHCLPYSCCKECLEQAAIPIVIPDMNELEAYAPLQTPHSTTTTL